MDIKNFVKGVRESKPPKRNKFLLSVIGLSTEAGEILDILKRKIKYGEKVDKLHLREEIGDALNYLSQIADSQKITLEECMELNIAKMKARYPKGFTKEKAINRNVKKEYAAMKKALSKKSK